MLSTINSLQLCRQYEYLRISEINESSRNRNLSLIKLKLSLRYLKHTFLQLILILTIVGLEIKVI